MICINDINIHLFTKKELLEKINEIPDDTLDIEVIPISFWYLDDTVYRIDFEYIIEREETSLEKELREFREAREKKQEEARKKIEEQNERELYEKLKAKYNY